jgi:hypothetical protein
LKRQTIITKEITVINDNDILQLLQSRELTSRPREVYKEENKKITNYASRDTREDADGEKVSARPALWPEAVASDPIAVDFVSSPKGESGNVICPRELTSRYSGISVQHVRTDKGVKIAITLQKPEWVDAGACQLATAELKRYDRLREIKARADDSEHFTKYLDNCKMDLQEAANREVCMGRLHQRGKRAAWLYDTLVVAFFENKKMSRVMLYLEGEEHVIELTHEMSESQQKFYHAQGIQGQIQSAKRVPKLDDLPLVKFGE